MRTRQGYVLATALILIPLSVVLIFSLVQLVISGAGFAKQQQSRAKAFYLAESGLNVAFHVFGANNYTGHTHEPDGTETDPADPGFLRNAGVPDLALDSDGWYRWEWNPGDDPAASFTMSGRAESYRFQVLFPDSEPPGHFRIVCEATVAGRLAVHQLEGSVDNAFNYVIFDNGDLADFTRSTTESTTGKIHANGDLFLRPYKTDGLDAIVRVIFDDTDPNLNIYTDEMTVGGNIVRHEDIWGMPDTGGTVTITNTGSGASHVVEGTAQGATGQGNAYDSYHPDWTDTGSNGAIDRWDGAVADRTLGAKQQSAPVDKAFKPGGYYDQNASVTIDSSTSAPWISETSFYNEAEERLVTVKEVDLQAMAAAGAWPSNGLVYSSVPVRLVNGHDLAGPFTLASQSTVYVKGDFNKQFPDSATRAAGTPVQEPAAILTSDRVYRLTSSFEDKSGPDYPSLASLVLGSGFPEATDDPLYPEDDANLLEVNAAIMDGTPTTDVRAWVDDPDNSHYESGIGLTVPLLGYLDLQVKQIDSDPAYLKVAYPQSEDFLENLQKVRLRTKGAFMHLRVADMANFDNSDADHDTTPWVVKSAYIPPDDQIEVGGTTEQGVINVYDPSLAAAPGAPSAAPFAPRVARKLRWIPVR